MKNSDDRSTNTMLGIERILESLNFSGTDDPTIVSLHEQVEGAFLIQNALSFEDCHLLESEIIALHESLDMDHKVSRRESQVHIPVHLESNHSLDRLCQRLQSCFPSTISPEASSTSFDHISHYLRLYHYKEGQFSAPHYDIAFHTTTKEGKLVTMSCYSMLLYLNSVSESTSPTSSNTSGATTFFTTPPNLPVTKSGKTPKVDGPFPIALHIQPKIGDCLVFPHGKYPRAYPSPLHEGSIVTQGSKTIIRTDLVYRPTKSISTPAPALAPAPALQHHEIEHQLVQALASITSTVDDFQILEGFCRSSITLFKGQKDTQEAEYQCDAVEKFFWYVYREQVGQQSKKRKTTTAKQPPSIELQSPYGREFSVTRRELAERVISHVDAHALAYLSTGPSISISAVIYFSTLPYLHYQSQQGRLMCDLCGKFVFKLEWHMKMKHETESHAKAFDAALKSSQALIQYCATQDHPFPAAELPTAKSLDPQDIEKAQSNPHLLRSLVQEHKIKKLTPALEACRSGDLAQLRALVQDRRFDPQVDRDNNGCSGLLWAAGFGHLEVCQFLVDECQVDLRLDVQRGRKLGRGYLGRSALHWACRNGHLDLVRWLVEEKKLDIDLPSADQTTPLCLAIWQCRVPVIEYLLRHHANPHLVNEFGCNAGHWSCISPCEDPHQILRVCQMLYHEHAVDFTLFNGNGQGCLHKASQRGHRVLCEWLIDTVVLAPAHFRPNAHEHSTPSRLAAFAHFPELSQILAVAEAQRL